MIKVAIIEDNEAYREALEILISTNNDIKIVYSASNLTGIRTAFARTKPHICIMDIQMPGLTGIEGVTLLKERFPSVNVFMLTVFDDDDNIFDSIKAGAVGYLLKKDPPELIIQAIRKVHAGETMLNGKIARKVLDFFSKKEIKKDPFEEYNLSKREKEILEYIISGLSYREIAARCFITLDTMYTHTRKIFAKLNVHSRAEIAAKMR